MFYKSLGLFTVDLRLSYIAKRAVFGFGCDLNTNMFVEQLRKIPVPVKACQVGPLPIALIIVLFSDLAFNCPTVLFELERRSHFFCCGSSTLECTDIIYKILIKHGHF